MGDPRALLPSVLALHQHLRDAVVAAMERQHMEALAAVDRDEAADTIYAIDVAAETPLEQFAGALSREHTFVLIAEGLPGGRRCYPAGQEEASAEWRIIVDPIDGTRGLMYQKRSAWVLTGVAPNRGPATSLRDIVLAVQTEVPLIKQHLCDQLYAVRGEGVTASRFNRLTKEVAPLRVRPSSAPDIAHGYASVARFFPGARDVLAAVDEAIVSSALGSPPPGKALCFEDQYASSGGQLYELLAGHDRFVADLRPLVADVLAGRGLPPALCCHPYDVCTALIAEEGGVIVTNPFGQPLDAPLDVGSDVAWVGYANAKIRQQIEPLLQEALRSHGLTAGRRAAPPTTRSHSAGMKTDGRSGH